MVNSNSGAQKSNRWAVCDVVPTEAQERCPIRSQPYGSPMEVCFSASSQLKIRSLEGGGLWVRVCSPQLQEEGQPEQIGARASVAQLWPSARLNSNKLWEQSVHG